jgi:sorbitol/mannitol transport system permease protein
LFGFLTAQLLNRRFVGRGVARTLFIAPFLVMPTVAAVMWKNVLYNPAFGLFSSTLAYFGLERVDWLATFPLASVIAILVWQWTPFMMLILLAGLQSLPQEQIEAARIDGAGSFSSLRYIVLPHLSRYIEIAVLMEVLFILAVFGVIFVTTSGGPGIATTNFSYHIYKEAFERWNIDRASALGIIAVILANLVVLAFLRVLKSTPNQQVST